MCQETSKRVKVVYEATVSYSLHSENTSEKQTSLHFISGGISGRYKTGIKFFVASLPRLPKLNE